MVRIIKRMILLLLLISIICIGTIECISNITDIGRQLEEYKIINGIKYIVHKVNHLSHYY